VSGDSTHVPRCTGNHKTSQFLNRRKLLTNHFPSKKLPCPSLWSQSTVATVVDYRRAVANCKDYATSTTGPSTNIKATSVQHSNTRTCPCALGKVSPPRHVLHLTLFHRRSFGKPHRLSHHHIYRVPRAKGRRDEGHGKGPPVGETPLQGKQPRPGPQRFLTGNARFLLEQEKQ